MGLFIKMSDEVKMLIDILFDPSARDDERHDAAMDIGKYNDERALKALLQIGSNPIEDIIILDACGESVAEILVNRDEFRKDALEKLTPIAKKTAYAFIKEHKPQWR